MDHDCLIDLLIYEGAVAPYGHGLIMIGTVISVALENVD